MAIEALLRYHSADLITPRKQRLPSTMIERVELARVSAQRARVLIVDDDRARRTTLEHHLHDLGYESVSARDGEEALVVLQREPIDAVLLDLVMPKIDGFEVLAHMRGDHRFAALPVIILSSLDDEDTIVDCISRGATDYVAWPFNPVLLNARLEASLSAKRLRDVEEAYVEQVRADRMRSDDLLRVMLPDSIAERLKDGERDIAEHFDEVTVLFADIVDFTPYAAQSDPQEVLRTLNQVFNCFDALCARHPVEKIKTIGDEFMAAAGLPIPSRDHALEAGALALDMLSALQDINPRLPRPVRIRIGLHSGPVIAGVIGARKLAYDLWGDTVNTAHRMQSSGIENAITVSGATYELLKDRCSLALRGHVQVKGKGEMRTYFLTGIA